MSLETFGARVRYLRRAWGLTQSDLYKLGGPARTTVVRIESRESNHEGLSENTIRGLASALKCHQHWLLTGEGDCLLDGIVPPEGREDILRENIASTKIPSIYKPDRVTTLSDPQVDWALVDRVGDIINRILWEWSGGTSANEVNCDRPEAYKLIYKYLHQKQLADPLGPLSLEINRDISTILMLTVK